MEQLNLLSVALGLGCLAGLNLYLTVFATGLAIHQHWLVLSSRFESLEVLGDPFILTISGVLFALEFFADKIPWVDSVWDAVHTVIRPIGAMLLAIQVLGHSSPAFSVIVALFAGTTALAAHTAKASTRLVANTSPEPFTNIALSVSEDAAVIGGIALIFHHPVVALALFLAGLVVFAYFAPRLLRSVKVKLWLIWHKLNEPAGRRSSDLPVALSPPLAEIFTRHNTLAETISWAAPCVCVKGRRIPPNVFGALVATQEDSGTVTFIGRKGRRPITQTIELHRLTVDRESKFLSENLLLAPDGAPTAKYRFVFPRSYKQRVDSIAAILRDQHKSRQETLAVS